VKTQAKTLDWKPTGVSDQFSLKLATGAIVLDFWPGLKYKVIILGKTGSQVDNIEIRTNDKEFQLVDDLYKLIVETNRAEILDDILKEIEKI
jgi:hypothetical protein